MTDQYVYGLMFLALLLAATYGIRRHQAVKQTVHAVKDSLASVLLW